MKGILLAGGHGTRLWPATRAVSKQLLPVYDKPMVHYPLSTLLLAGIRDILAVSTPEDLPQYRRLLGTGRDLGVSFTYQEQPRPGGIAEAFVLGRDFVGKDSVTLILGDNVHYGHGLPGVLREAVASNPGATIFGYRVKDPQRYGVAELDRNGRVVGLEEKPKKPRSDHAVTGLYVYDNEVVDLVRRLKPSARGELEITDLNRLYLKKGKLRLVKMGRGMAWLDTGTHQSLLEASNFIATIEHRQGLKVACLEEVAYRMGFIDKAQLLKLAGAYKDGDYRAYLVDIAAREGA
ncbi:MAG: glucose-1-phosphate thymidylyltransferase RfbA [Euryarchaeota archaeon]|nr:glucose-1-phosphate thymidylyltransferase RfbA [Euryarchaeota archaeon]